MLQFNDFLNYIVHIDSGDWGLYTIIPGPTFDQCLVATGTLIGQLLSLIKQPYLFTFETAQFACNNSLKHACH